MAFLLPVRQSVLLRTISGPRPTDPRHLFVLLKDLQGIAGG